VNAVSAHARSRNRLGHDRSSLSAAVSPGALGFGRLGAAGCGRGAARARRPGGVVPKAVLEQREGALGEPADVGGQADRLLVGQDPSAGVVDQCVLDADEGVRGDLGSDVVGRGAGLGGEPGGEGVGAAGDRLLLPREEGRTGGDHAVDGPQPLQGRRVCGFDLREQPTGLQQGAPEGGETFVAVGHQMIDNLGAPMAILLPLALLSALVTLVLLWRGGGGAAFWWLLAGFLLMVAALAVTLAVEVPIDNQIQTWTAATLPGDWRSIRSRWELFHTIRTFLSIGAVVAATIGSAVRRPEPARVARPAGRAVAG
jgi:hypothetical protein